MSALDQLPQVETATVATAHDLASVVAAARPILLKGFVRDWPAVAKARQGPPSLNAYVKAMDRGMPGPVMEAPAASGGRFGYAGDVREFTFTKRQRGISETLDRIERGLGQPDAPVIAIQMLPLSSHLPSFVADNPMPWLAKVSPLLWLGGPVRTQIHNDRDHNLACVVAGRRRFLLFPPDQVGNLYIGPLDNPPPLSLVDPEQPDIDRFPRFADALAVATIAELEPGDAIFMPRHWWHHVASRDPYNAMVNYWWGERPRGLDDPHAAFLAALNAIRHLPQAERSYWRAMMDVYVFADGADHLPSAARGMLGRMSPAQRSQLRQRLKSAAAQT